MSYGEKEIRAELEGLASKCNEATGNEKYSGDKFFCPICKNSKPSCKIIEIDNALGASCRACYADADALFEAVGETNNLPTATTKSEQTKITTPTSKKVAVSGISAEQMHGKDNLSADAPTAYDNQTKKEVSIDGMRRLCCDRAGVPYLGPNSQVPCPMPEHSNQHHSPTLKIFPSGKMNCLGGKCGAKDSEGRTIASMIYAALDMVPPSNKKVKTKEDIHNRAEAAMRGGHKPKLKTYAGEFEKIFNSELQVSLEFILESARHQQAVCEYWSCEFEEVDGLPIGGWQRGLGRDNGVSDIFYDDRITVPCFVQDSEDDFIESPVNFQGILASPPKTGSRKTLFVKGAGTPSVSLLGIEKFSENGKPLVLTEGAGDAVVALLAGYPAGFCGGVSGFFNAIDVINRISRFDHNPLSVLKDAKFICLYDRDEAGERKMQADKIKMNMLVRSSYERGSQDDDFASEYCLILTTPPIEDAKDLRDIRGIGSGRVDEFLEESASRLQEYHAPRYQDREVKTRRRAVLPRSASEIE